jgi:hypothetical protein
VPRVSDAVALQVRAGGVVAFRQFSTVLACPAAWGGGSRGYYEVEVLETGLYTQAQPFPLLPLCAHCTRKSVMRSWLSRAWVCCLSIEIPYGTQPCFLDPLPGFPTLSMASLLVTSMFEVLSNTSFPSLKYFSGGLPLNFHFSESCLMPCPAVRLRSPRRHGGGVRTAQRSRG